jgi:hypothetical protein
MCLGALAGSPTIPPSVDRYFYFYCARIYLVSLHNIEAATSKIKTAAGSMCPLLHTENVLSTMSTWRPVCIADQGHSSLNKCKTPGVTITSRIDASIVPSQIWMRVMGAALMGSFGLDSAANDPSQDG